MDDTQLLTHFQSMEIQNRYMELYDRELEAWPDDLASRYVDTEFGATFVIECGKRSAPPLVLFHWFSYNSTIWGPMIPFLADRFHIFAVDVIGDMGRSNAVVPPETEERLAEWGEQVITGLGMEHVQMVGFSNGGFTAAVIARERPEMVDRLVLLSPAATIDRFSLVFFSTVVRTALFTNQRNIERFKRRFTFYPQRWTAGMEEMLRLAFAGSQIQVMVWPRPFTDEELGQLSMPTMLLVGAEENIYRSRAPQDRFERFVPEGRVVVLDRCRHAITLDQPAAAAAAIAGFLSEAATERRSP